MGTRENLRSRVGRFFRQKLNSESSKKISLFSFTKPINATYDTLRKLFAIAMLTVYLFNLAGYNFLFHYYINQSDQTISRQADLGDYSDAALIEIKIKLNLPYLTDWSGYQRYDGETEINGVHYNCVKRKVSQDTLYLLCLPNEVKTQLYHTKADYAVTANDLPAEKQNKNSTARKGFAPEIAKIQLLQFDFLSFVKGTTPLNSSLRSDIADTYIARIGQPPEFTC